MPGGSVARRPLVALVDESISVTGTGTYVVAAAVIEQRQKDSIRADLRRLVPSRHRFHFHAEKPQTRLAVLSLLSECAETAFAYRVTPAPSRANEKARERCLNALWSDMSPQPMRELILDSRAERNDARDRLRIVTAQRSGRLRTDLRSHLRTCPRRRRTTALAGRRSRRRNPRCGARPPGVRRRAARQRHRPADSHLTTPARGPDCTCGQPGPISGGSAPPASIG